MTSNQQMADSQKLEMAALEVAQNLGLSCHFDRPSYTSGGISAFLTDGDLNANDLWLINLSVSYDKIKKFEYHVQPLMRFDGEAFKWTQYFHRRENEYVISPSQKWVAENPGRFEKDHLDPTYLDWVRHTFKTIVEYRELRRKNEARIETMQSAAGTDRDGAFTIGDIHGRLTTRKESSQEELAFQVEMSIPINDAHELEELMQWLRSRNEHKCNAVSGM